MTENIELVDIAEVRDGKAIVSYSRTEAALADLRTKYAGATYDLTTTAGDKAARSARLALVTLRGDLEKKRKELKAPALEFGKKIDAEAARITAEIQALESPIDAQIKADEKRRDDERRAREAAEAARKKVHIDGIAKIAGYVGLAADLPATRIEAGIAHLRGLDLSGFEEFAQEAATTRDRTVVALEALHVKAVAREAEEARLKAEREEQARVAAEQAEAARKLREEQEELERRRAAVEAEERRQEAERNRIRAEEAARLEREAAARAAEAARAAATPAPTQPPAAAPIASPAVSSQAANVVPLGTRAPTDTGARLRLGEINSRLAPIALTAEGLATLGFQPVATEKAAKLYRASDLDRICAALVSRLVQVREEIQKAA